MSTTTEPEAPRRTKRLTGRPSFYRSYSQELALFNTRPKLVWVGAIIVLAFATPFFVPGLDAADAGARVRVLRSARSG